MEKYVTKLLNEALPLKIAKEYTAKWTPAMRERYKEVFGDKYRIYFPFTRPSDPKKVRIPPEIKKAVEDAGYEIVDYLKGHAKRTGVDTKNLTKISGILGKIDNELKKKFDADPERAGAGKEKAEYYIVISRHPYDIVGMSSDRGWSSCMTLGSFEGDEWVWDEGSQCGNMIKDIKYGSLIAYLVDFDDKNIKRPTARILIKPYFKGKNAILKVGSVYGANIPGFKKFVESWVDKKFNAKAIPGRYEAPPGYYTDTLPRTYTIDKPLTVDEVQSRIVSVSGCEAIEVHNVEQLTEYLLINKVQKEFFRQSEFSGTSIIGVNEVGQFIFQGGKWGNWEGRRDREYWNTLSKPTSFDENDSFKYGFFDGGKLDCFHFYGEFQNGVLTTEMVMPESRFLNGEFFGGTFKGDFEGGTFKSGIFKGKWFGGKFDADPHPENRFEISSPDDRIPSFKNAKTPYDFRFLTEAEVKTRIQKVLIGGTEDTNKENLWEGLINVVRHSENYTFLNKNAKYQNIVLEFNTTKLNYDFWLMVSGGTWEDGVFGYGSHTLSSLFGELNKVVISDMGLAEYYALLSNYICWYDGVFKGGTFSNSIWYGGTWAGGKWDNSARIEKVNNKWCLVYHKTNPFTKQKQEQEQTTTNYIKKLLI